MYTMLKATIPIS